MGRVFIYLDNAHTFHEAQRFAEERNEGPDARYRVRINFDNILRLAHADRAPAGAVAAGSIPPEMRQLWNRMEAAGVEVRLFDRGSPERSEQDTPDRILQLGGDPFLEALLQPADAPVGGGQRRVVALDDFYDSITFMTPSRPGFEHALGRQSSTLDLSLRKMS